MSVRDAAHALAWLCLLACGAAGRAAAACPAGCACALGVQREYACGALDAVQQDGEFLRLACSAPHALNDTAALPALLDAALQAPDASVADCAPPPAGWHAALSALGATHVQRLTIRAPDAFEGPYWRREHFAGFDTLQSLKLEGGGSPPADLLQDVRTLRRLTLRTGPSEGNVPPLPPGNELSWIEFGGDATPERLAPRWLAAAPSLRGLVVLGAGRAAAAQPDALAGLPRLATLQLRHVALGALPAGWLRGALLPALHTARLDACALTALPPDLLAGAHALRNLSLLGNRLSTLPATLLSGCPLLQRLELQENRLLTLPDALLAPLTKLYYLDLSSNGLERLSM